MSQGRTPTPAEVSDMPCEWCGKPAEVALPSNSPGQFIYVCRKDENFAHLMSRSKPKGAR